MPREEERDETFLDRIRAEWDASAKPLLWLVYSAFASMRSTPSSPPTTSAAYADMMVEEFKKRFIPEGK